MGQTQFMPISFLNYAVDYDGDGKKDIWGTKADVFASIANYLSSEGWDSEGTWGRQVILTKAVPFFREHQHEAVGLFLAAASSATTEMNSPMQKSVHRLLPDGEQGQFTWCITNFTMMKWNRSSYFGVSVGYLSERIKRGY